MRKKVLGFFYGRRAWWWIVPILLLLAAPLLRYGYMQMRFPAADVLMGVPRNVVMVIEGEGFLTFASDISSNAVWSYGYAAPYTRDHLSLTINELQSMSGGNSELGGVLSKNRYSVALAPKKLGGPALLFLLEVGGGVSYETIHESFASHWEGYSPKRLLEIDYYERPLDNNATLYITIQQGILIAAIDREVFELAYYTLESGNSIAKDSGFMEARAQLSKSKNPFPRVYLSHEALYGWFSRFINSGSRKAFSVIPDMGSWSAFELMSDHQEMHMQGFTIPSASNANYSRESLVTGGGELEDPGSVLPATTLFFDQRLLEGGYSMGFGRALASDSSVRNYGIEQDLLDSALIVMDELHILSATFALTASSDSLLSHQGLLLLRSGRIQHAQRAMLMLADTARGFAHQEFQVYPVAKRLLLPALFGARYQSFRESWFTAVDDYLIFAPSSGELLGVLNAITLQRTLSFEPGYSEMGSRMPGVLSLRYYFHNGNSPHHLKRIGAPEQLTNIDRFMHFMPGQMMVCLLQEEDVLLTDIVMGSYPALDIAGSFIPEVVLDGVPLSSPVSFFDHRVQAEKVVVADRTGHLYLISPTGGIDWKIKAREMPRSDLFVVDLYQNGRHQTLFLSDNMLHLIQTDGNYVQGYPVTLPVSFGGFMSVLDYDRNGNYRIIYRSHDGRLVNIDKSGNIVAGWESPVLLGVSRPVVWLRVGEYDFLVAADSLGGVHLFDRRGRLRFQNMELPEISNYSDFVVTRSLGQAWMTYLDKEGHLQQISAAGDVQKHELLHFSPDAALKGVEGAGGSIGSFITTEPSRITLYDRDAKVISRNEAPGITVSSFYAFSRSGKLSGAGIDTDGVPFLLLGEKMELKRFTDKGYDEILTLRHGIPGQSILLLTKGLLLSFYTVSMDKS